MTRHLIVTAAALVLAACTSGTPSQPTASSSPTTGASATPASTAPGASPTAGAAASPYGTGTAVIDGKESPWTVEPRKKGNALQLDAAFVGGTSPAGALTGLTLRLDGGSALPAPGFKLEDLATASVTYGGGGAFYSYTGKKETAGSMDVWTFTNTATRIVGTFDGQLAPAGGSGAPLKVKLTFDAPYPQF